MTSIIHKVLTTELADDPYETDIIEIGDYVKFTRKVWEHGGTAIHHGAGYVTSMNGTMVRIDCSFDMYLDRGDTMELHSKQFRLEV